jgi:hypothetical protein
MEENDRAARRDMQDSLIGWRLPPSVWNEVDFGKLLTAFEACERIFSNESEMTAFGLAVVYAGISQDLVEVDALV